MTEAHIKEATKMLGWFFDRCGKVPHYKGMMYVKNADNLKVLLVLLLVGLRKKTHSRLRKSIMKKIHIRYISRTEMSFLFCGC